MKCIFLFLFILFSISCTKSTLVYRQLVTYTFNGNKIKLGDSQFNFLFRDSLAPGWHQYNMGFGDYYHTNGFQVYFATESFPLNRPFHLPLASFKYNGLIATNNATNNLINDSKFTFLITRYSHGTIDGKFHGRLKVFLENNQMISDSIGDGQLIKFL